MVGKRIGTAVLIWGLLAACQPGLIREQRTRTKQPTPDSTLYYTQKVLKDSFLDSLKNDHSAVTVYLTLTPPPAPPPPRFKTIDGFRVQLFAGLDSLNGKSLAAGLSAVAGDTVYFFREQGLYKVQVGDYAWRNEADMKVLDLRKKGYLQGWVVQRPINWPADSTDASVNAGPAADPAPPAPVQQGAYHVQVLVTADAQKAHTVRAQLQNKWGHSVEVLNRGGVYKIVFGAFQTREDAEKWRDRLKENGFKDAWITH
ncbi:MAG: SPOR domain-containing protein [Calditrichaeota bacterium]|nr:MAG: SPOR domain-containing protein [Calditrichota bacterium]